MEAVKRRSSPMTFEEAKVRALQDALIAGEQSGDTRPFNFEAFKAGKRAAYNAK